MPPLPPPPPRRMSRPRRRENENVSRRNGTRFIRVHHSRVHFGGCVQIHSSVRAHVAVYPSMNPSRDILVRALCVRTSFSPSLAYLVAPARGIERDDWWGSTAIRRARMIIPSRPRRAGKNTIINLDLSIFVNVETWRITRHNMTVQVDGSKPSYEY